MVHGLIFAAGLGTRLKPLTDTMPKALVPLAGKPLLQWQVEKLRDAGINDIVVNVHHFPDQIIDTIRANDGWGCTIRISDERDALLDTGGGLRKAWRDGLFAGPDGQAEAVLACNVDILSNIDLPAFLQKSANCPRYTLDKSSISLLVVSERQTQRYLCFDNRDMLCGWTNITTGEVKGKDGRHLAFSGMQLLRPDVIKRLDEMKEDKFSLIDFYLHLCAENQSINPSIHHSSFLQSYIPENYKMMDVGKISQINDAEFFAKMLCNIK